MPTKKLCSGTQTFGGGSFQIWKIWNFDTPPLFFFLGGGRSIFVGFHGFWPNMYVYRRENKKDNFQKRSLQVIFFEKKKYFLQKKKFHPNLKSFFY